MDDAAPWASSSMVEIPLAGILVGLFHSHSHSPAESKGQYISLKEKDALGPVGAFIYYALVPHSSLRASIYYALSEMY